MPSGEKFVEDDLVHLPLQHSDDNYCTTDNVVGTPAQGEIDVNIHAQPMTEDEKKQEKPKKSKPFRCDVCGGNFNRKVKLDHHIKLHHLSIKDFQCNLCQKKFGYKHVLSLHLRSHTKEKAFECKICPKKFKHQASLNKHILAIHEGEKFQCQICNIEFGRKDNLKAHMKRKHQK